MFAKRRRDVKAREPNDFDSVKGVESGVELLDLLHSLRRSSLTCDRRKPYPTRREIVSSG